MKPRTIPKKPSETQAALLRRIAHSGGMMVTRRPGKPLECSLLTGEAIPAGTGQALIRNGWVRGQRDGIDGDSQVYRTLTAN